MFRWLEKITNSSEKWILHWYFHAGMGHHGSIWFNMQDSWNHEWDGLNSLPPKFSWENLQVVKLISLKPICHHPWSIFPYFPFNLTPLFAPKNPSHNIPSHPTVHPPCTSSTSQALGPLRALQIAVPERFTLIVREPVPAPELVKIHRTAMEVILETMGFFCMSRVFRKDGDIASLRCHVD